MDELRRMASEQIGRGDWTALAATIREALSGAPSPRTYALVNGWLQQIGDCVPDPKTIRVVVLRSYTIDRVAVAMKCWAAAMGLWLDVDVQPYEHFEQVMLEQDGVLARTPEAVIVAPRLRELAPRLEARVLELTATERTAAADDVCERIGSWLKMLRDRVPRARLFVTGMALPSWPAFGLAETAVDVGHRALVGSINHRVASQCREMPDVHFIDVDWVLSSVGYDHAFDPRMDLHARQPFSAQAISRLGEHLGRALAAAFVARKKCLVLDCDNTLWGGTVGEDGLDGIALGGHYPGNAYVAFQEEVLGLHKRGVILAIASKNNESDVVEVLDSHPHQVLRSEHFSAKRITWGDKATSLCELATELGIGLDSLVLVDDSEVECALVRQACPEVEAVLAPSDPMQLAGLVRRLHQFDALRLSDEDLNRGELYLAQNRRGEAQRHAATMDEFLRSLKMALVIEPVRPASIGRVAQLTQRTNQFNLTSRRYGESEIRTFVERSDREAYSVQLRDRFGTYGICGVALLEIQPDAVVIDTLLLSCRVIGRAVENVVVPFLQQRAASHGARRLLADYVPTKKNAQVRDLYGRFGFDKQYEADTHARWSWSPSSAPLEIPEFLTVEITTA